MHSDNSYNDNRFNVMPCNKAPYNIVRICLRHQPKNAPNAWWEPYIVLFEKNWQKQMQKKLKKN